MSKAAQLDAAIDALFHKRYLPADGAGGSSLAEDHPHLYLIWKAELAHLREIEWMYKDLCK